MRVFCSKKNILLKGESAGHRIYRLESRMKSPQGKVALTQFEQKSAVPEKLYDVFSAAFIADTDKSHSGEYEAIVTLEKPSPEISLKGEVVNRDTGEVVATVPESKVQNSTNHAINDTFEIKDVAPEKLAFVVHAEYTAEGSVQTPTCVSDLKLRSGGLAYNHIYPKKEPAGKPVIFGQPEGLNVPAFQGEPDSGHIVVALMRMPEDKNDVDYICGWGTCPRRQTLSWHPRFRCDFCPEKYVVYRVLAVQM